MEQQQKRPSNPLPVILLIALAVSLIFSLTSRSKLSDKSYSQVLQMFEEEAVREFDLTADGLLSLTLHEPEDGQDTLLIQIGDVDQFHQDLDELIVRQKAAGILENYNYLPADDSIELGDVLPYLFMALALIILIVVIVRRTGGNNPAQYLQVNARVSKVNVTFDDVAGSEEEKEELRDVVEFLRDPARFTRLGARIPKGILLEGPPGTGKTLLARAVAGEAGVQFFSITGSDFVEMFVGVGAGRVRNLFEQARKVAPSIVFIDEIDAVGRRRGSGLGGGHDEREQTLNQLLVEMDGFGQNEGIVVMAATNRKDILDPALLRPGRFDRQVYVGRPDRRARAEILKIHTKNKPLAETVDLDAVAAATVGFTGADLENLTNEAALMAAKANQQVVTQENMDEAMLKVVAGPAKRSRVISPEERRMTAIHEAGHAVAMYHLPTHDPVRQVTIIPRGSSGGSTWSQPQDEKSYMSRKQMYELIVAYLGGRVAEQLFLDDISTGASHDIRQATELARNMVSQYGMSQRLGTVAYGSDDEIFIGRDYEKSKSYSERFAGDIDEEIKAIIDEAYAHCTKLLTDHRAKVQLVADRLLEQETLDQEAFEAIMQADAE